MVEGPHSGNFVLHGGVVGQLGQRAAYRGDRCRGFRSGWKGPEAALPQALLCQPWVLPTRSLVLPERENPAGHQTEEGNELGDLNTLCLP